MKYFHTHFDDLWDMLHKGIPADYTKVSTCHMPTYPYSNVILSEDTNTMTLEFALAGYDEKEISVTANNNVLTITADPKDSQEKCSYIHHGISRRKINFSLSVDKAFNARNAKTSFKNGLLRIEMIKTADSLAVKLM